MIDFYTADTPNGLRVELMLEELGLASTKYPLSLSQGETHTPEFLKLNPSARIPVIVDHDVSGGVENNVANREPITLTQSVAILLYLSKKTGEFLPRDTRSRAKAMEWLFFDATDIATTRFDAFFLSMKDQPQATKILKDRVMAYYTVYDQHLASSEFLAGSKYSLADIAAYPWAKTMEHEGMDDLSNVQRWMKTISERASVKKINLYS